LIAYELVPVKGEYPWLSAPVFRSYPCTGDRHRRSTSPPRLPDDQSGAIPSRSSRLFGEGKFNCVSGASFSSFSPYWHCRSPPIQLSGSQRLGPSHGSLRSWRPAGADSWFRPGRESWTHAQASACERGRDTDRFDTHLAAMTIAVEGRESDGSPESGHRVAPLKGFEGVGSNPIAAAPST
jgi:hypothetical protein